jgi:hypothetical protein
MIRAHETNRGQIDSWLWMARHALRKGNVPRACEAMLSALWLMGVPR